MKKVAKFLFALAFVIVLYVVAYRDGRENGERGLGYWQGWQDAMLQTDYGNKPYHSSSK